MLFRSQQLRLLLQHVVHLSADAAEGDPSVLMGTLKINSFTAEVLYDSGASHSFMSEVFARRHNITFQSISTPFVVKTPGSRWQTSWVPSEFNITVGTLSFPFSMISLKTDGIDAIMGMDWLSKYKAKLDCAARTIQLTDATGDSILSY